MLVQARFGCTNILPELSLKSPHALDHATTALTVYHNTIPRRDAATPRCGLPSDFPSLSSPKHGAMGRPSWADDEQTAWLWGRHDAFLTARRDADSDTDMVSGFMTKTQQQFFDKFPLCAEPLEPSPDGKMPTMEERITRREQVSSIPSWHTDTIVLTIAPANLLVVLESPLQEDRRQEGDAHQPFPRACAETAARSAAVSGIHASV